MLKREKRFGVLVELRRSSPLVGCFNSTIAASLITPDHWKVLLQWLPKTPKKPRVLFSTSVHGWSAAEFHRLCDGKGPTLTIMRSPSFSFPRRSYLFGGYNHNSWSSTSGEFNRDPGCTGFLFSLDKGAIPVKCSPNNFEGAIENYSSYGPSFGSGDLRLSGFNSKSGNNCAPQNPLGGCSAFTDGCGIVLAQVDVISWSVSHL